MVTDTGNQDRCFGSSQRALTMCPALGDRGSEDRVPKGASSSAVADYQSAKKTPRVREAWGRVVGGLGRLSPGCQPLSCRKACSNQREKGQEGPRGQEVRVAESRQPGSWPAPE